MHLHSSSGSKALGFRASQSQRVVLQACGWCSRPAPASTTSFLLLPGPAYLRTLISTRCKAQCYQNKFIHEWMQAPGPPCLGILRSLSLAHRNWADEWWEALAIVPQVWTGVQVPHFPGSLYTFQLETPTPSSRSEEKRMLVTSSNLVSLKEKLLYTMNLHGTQACVSKMILKRVDLESRQLLLHLNTGQ